uniref:RxLR effector protein n=1 Tax=Phytophthora agathidicida TaxID=1642459 RepID=A0A7G4WI21_9STRA|nr:PaRXLR32 [Phytophthora agathidicida]
MRANYLLLLAAAIFVASCNGVSATTTTDGDKLSVNAAPVAALSVPSVDGVSEKRFLRKREDDDVQEERGRFGNSVAALVKEGWRPSEIKQLLKQQGAKNIQKKLGKFNAAWLKKYPGGFNEKGLN